MSNQKGFSKIGLIIIILAVMAFLYFSLYGEKQNTSQNNKKNSNTSQSSVENLIKDWNTYRNENFDIEVKYPQNWTVLRSGENIAITEKVKEYKIEIKKIKNPVIGYAKQTDMILFKVNDITAGRFKENKYDERVSLVQFNSIFKIETFNQALGDDLQVNKALYFDGEKYLAISYFGSEKEPLATILETQLINEMDVIVKTLKFGIQSNNSLSGFQANGEILKNNSVWNFTARKYDPKTDGWNTDGPYKLKFTDNSMCQSTTVESRKCADFIFTHDRYNAVEIKGTKKDNEIIVSNLVIIQ